MNNPMHTYLILYTYTISELNLKNEFTKAVYEVIRNNHDISNEDVSNAIQDAVGKDIEDFFCDFKEQNPDLAIDLFVTISQLVYVFYFIDEQYKEILSKLVKIFCFTNELTDELISNDFVTESTLINIIINSYLVNTVIAVGNMDLKECDEYITFVREELHYSKLEFLNLSILKIFTLLLSKPKQILLFDCMYYLSQADENRFSFVEQNILTKYCEFCELDYINLVNDYNSESFDIDKVLHSLLKVSTKDYS